MLLQDGAEDKQSIVEWHGPDKRTQDGWANKDDATEFGATHGLALAAVELTRGMVAVRRAETRTGVDYYLGGPEAPADDLEATFRLEVSGTDEGNDTVIQSRLRQKLDQATAGASNLPAIATVVGFAALKIVTERSPGPFRTSPCPGIFADCFPQRVVFQHELPFAGDESFTAQTARCFKIDGLGPRFSSGDLVQSIAVRAAEKRRCTRLGMSARSQPSEAGDHLKTCVGSTLYRVIVFGTG